MKSNPVFRVLACIDLSSEAGQQRLGGIYRFLSEGYDWDLSLIRSQKEFGETFRKRTATNSFDGFLIAVPEDPDLRALHKTLGKPTAFVDYADRRFLQSFRDCVFVYDDDNDIGRCAAQNLLSQGPFNSYGYAEASDNRPWNRRRGDRFAAALARHGIPVSRLADTDTRPVESIAEWLKSMPRPIGILAAYDDAAQRILDACRMAGLRVPADVSVLGIGNDGLICTHTNPPLSSIIPDFENEGYRAARELQAMMLHRRKPTRREILCGCKGIAKRGSTAGEKSAAMLVQQATAFIRENAFKGITASDVVAQLRVSRRLADLRFREATGTSILAYITDIRLARAKHLLATTGLRIGEIARQCGYEAHNLSNLFQRRVGRSMRDFRHAAKKGG